VSRRRLTPARAAALLASALRAAPAAPTTARIDLHGALRIDGRWMLAADVSSALADRAIALVAAHHAAEPDSPGILDAALRRELALAARRLTTLGAEAADEVASDLVDGLVTRGALARDHERLRDPGRAAGLPAATLAAMDRLEAALAVPAPPPLDEAARAAGCPPDGVRALVAAGRIVTLEADLAWAATTYRDLAARALAMAAVAPLTPAAFRDATGTSRRYVLAILEDLDRRGHLRRTDAGHVLGPKAP
jgi:selenocysteine-specific elongation factor